jgi:hypothetical protein
MQVCGGVVSMPQRAQNCFGGSRTPQSGQCGSGEVLGQM